jgi:sialic acid synthase SpsE|tara:strand:+ start:645 stop:1649 length:1005 start_codon:yes stop_codon:yes gene_type:complete
MKKFVFKVKEKKFISYKKIMVIAEIGSNHDNDFEKCRTLIEKASKIGCDAIKIQMFKADELISTKHPAYNFLKKYELKKSWLEKISKICKKNNILFMCSPFYKDAIPLLKKSKCDILKIASPEIKNLPLIKKAINSGLPIIISTGDSDLEIIHDAIKIFKRFDKKKLAILHCTSQYPASLNNLNLNNIENLNKKFPKISIGFSDHSSDDQAACIASSLGVNIIEKHITLNKNSKGPDHSISMNIKDFKIMVDKIRNVKIILGNKNKRRLNDENTVYINIFSKKILKKNKKIKLVDLICKRDFKNKIPSKYIDKIVDKIPKIDIEKDTPLEWRQF